MSHCLEFCSMNELFSANVFFLKVFLRSGFERGYGGAHGHEGTGDQTTEAKHGKKVWAP